LHIAWSIQQEDLKPMTQDQPSQIFNSLEHEMSVLGSMLLSDRAAEEMVILMDESDFYRPAHREIFKAMSQLIKTGKPASDIELLKQELKDRSSLQIVGGEEYLIEVATFVPSPANVNYYAGGRSGKGDTPASSRMRPHHPWGYRRRGAIRR
jgi:hypothetical protein